MAILDSTPDVFGPTLQVQEEPLARGAGIGAMEIGFRYRTVYQYRLTWPIDASGGDSLPGTYVDGTSTYRLVSTSIDRPYSGLSGTITALYWREDEWTTVWEEVITS